jgi:hypothetical protein
MNSKSLDTTSDQSAVRWGPTPLDDAAAIRGVLIVAARAGKAVTYSELLGVLGHHFTRSRMRVVCRTLDVIDVAARAAGEPELAVLVVRASDGLPGHGWWVDRERLHGYSGRWTGPEAARYIQDRQSLAFKYWRARDGKRVKPAAVRPSCAPC